MLFERVESGVKRRMTFRSDKDRRTEPPVSLFGYDQVLADERVERTKELYVGV
jgi:hypothetical protein